MKAKQCRFISFHTAKFRVQEQSYEELICAKLNAAFILQNSDVAKISVMVKVIGTYNYVKQYNTFTALWLQKLFNADIDSFSVEHMLGTCFKKLFHVLLSNILCDLLYPRQCWQTFHLLLMVFKYEFVQSQILFLMQPFFKGKRRWRFPFKAIRSLVIKNTEIFLVSTSMVLDFMRLYMPNMKQVLCATALKDIICVAILFHLSSCV